MSGNGDSISITDVDETQRSLTALIRTTRHQVVLHISVPLSYPENAIPVFQFGKGTTFDASGKSKMSKVISFKRMRCF